MAFIISTALPTQPSPAKPSLDYSTSTKGDGAAKGADGKCMAGIWEKYTVAKGANRLFFSQRPFLTPCIDPRMDDIYPRPRIYL
jgi:hypothetical protein